MNASAFPPTRSLAELLAQAGPLPGTTSQPELRRVAEAAARAGGAVARRFFRTQYHVRFKDDLSEVSDADEAAQAAVIAAIRAHRPDDAFIAEETLVHPDAGPDLPAPEPDRLCWVIDPIDGTRNFVRGIPWYACSVAVLHRGLPIAAATYAVESNTLYSASQAEGLCTHGQSAPAAARHSPPALDPRPLVALPSTPKALLAELCAACLSRYVCRNFGSTALHLALLASGELDGVVADNPRLWDLAAGWLLVLAAGARMTGPRGEPIFPLETTEYRGDQLPTLAGTPGVHAELLQIQSETSR